MTKVDADGVPSGTGRPTGVAPAAVAPRAAANHSRFVARVRRRWPDDLAKLAPGVPSPEAIGTLIDTLLASNDDDLGSALRIARHLVLERLAVLDVECSAPLADVVGCVSSLADTVLERALAAALADTDARHGAPRNEAGERIDFWIVGMGKLGARELNVSSDIDLIYVYEEDGTTDGITGGTSAEGRTSRVSAHEYFCALARRLQQLVGDTTDDGFVFRVDLALRPNGMSGPPVVSLAMLETYLLVQGREWERFAWLKSRVVAPAASVQSGRARALRALVTPFVYRRHLDWSVFEGLRQMHRLIREQAQRRAAGRPERASDVKLSRGGIREIEFVVQLLLIVRGGQFPEIRTRSTLRGLQRLTARGLMRPETAQRLAQAYELLRRIEHRIQYLDDEQTHLLPVDDGDLRWIATSLGFVGDNPMGELLQALSRAREDVAEEFDALLHDDSTPRNGAPCKGCGPEPAAVDDQALLSSLPDALRERIARWAAQPKVQALRDDSKLRLGRLVQRLGAETDGDDPRAVQAAIQFVDWLDPLLRRDSYLALLAERPKVQRRLLRLLGLARWPARYLMQHPSVIDELADERFVQARFERDQYLSDLDARHAAWQRADDAGEESLIDGLRHAHHAEVFRTLVRDVEGHLSVEQVADDLSALADSTLEVCIRWAWLHLKQRHRSAPKLAVIAYGKLGGKELGYGSDLDVVFLYDDDDERAAEVYAAFVRKLITWLTVRTSAGELFDIDTALRPNGNSGLLVTSIASFEQYQSGRGSNTAWTWEHQAITRARWCAGDSTLAKRFDATRRAVLCAPRGASALRDEIKTMRDKVRTANPEADGRFDVKHGRGGMMDVEFCVQHLVLAHAAKHEILLGNTGNIALLHAAQGCGLLPHGVGAAAADAYRALRREQHRARLDDRPTIVDLDDPAQADVRSARAAVQSLWQAVFA
jgi:[glutamine synthetase] adenylyltransferase / [glutamine synthetase]-adenylyl-L-tyrosine phosphorylase